ncbi:hypothetical protein AB0C84_35060 [Actinomadura sp. NPDC048955]|uniref:DUF4333 domain-containing protein n=1 Tax=Actinomadura luteofluorescens TaxID=46163 RepID=A0A7Y9JFX1_9ACTN|nr:MULTISPECIES: hypothetical protein [Actinomadura]MCR3745621.1 hypothetical protein [Actinomadura glauciflava]NYD47033.1 hypothetical protein [Actinomadura luteofluorescens]
MRRLPAAVLVLLLAVTMSGCKVMQRISDGAYRNAVSDGVVDELDAQGIKLRERPDCESPGRETDSVVRVDCTARTTTGEPVVVEGVAHDADTERPLEAYVVTVGGREVLRKECLGLGCEHPNG